MRIFEAQEKILKLKKEKNAAIMAHSYQSQQILEVADYTGDSYALAKFAMNVEQENIILCGVKFMAETAKMLAPHKRVFMPNENAGCPMAESLDPELLAHLRKAEPQRKVVGYINTTAKLKEQIDVCVTSSSAVKILKNIPYNSILFIPDCNLGDYVKKRVPEKDIKLIQGGCPVHAAVTVSDVEEAKKLHPGALLLVHPECDPKVVSAADYVGSTSGIMDFAKNSSEREFIIGTEISIAEHLQFECPNKKFYIMSKKITCPNMKLTTIMDVFDVLSNLNFAYEIKMAEEEIRKSKICVDEMLKYGG